MEDFTFDELNELKILAVYAHNFELAATVLKYIRKIYPNEKCTEKIMIGKKTNRKKHTIHLNHKLITIGGKQIDTKFMEELFPMDGQ